MTKIASLIFLNVNRELRSIWWVVIFFAILSLFLFPIIFLADYYRFEITYWLQVILIMAVSALCQAFRRNPLHDLTGKINKVWFRELLIGLMIGAMLMIIPAILLTMTGTIQWQLNKLSPSAFVSGISVMLSAVLAEELLFRGFIFQRLIDSTGPWPAQLIIGGLFLLTHLNNPGMTGLIKILASINIFIASLFFGIAYIKTKNLAMPIGLHFMANVMQGTILGFGVSGEKEVSILTPIVDKVPAWLTGGTFGLEASVPGLFLLVVISSALYFWYPSNNKIEINC
jgi:membrane protease YdiL (CAAX protease family)